jgi:hypothetical protein
LPFLVEKYLGTVEVRDADSGQSELCWSIETEVGASNKDEMKGLIQSAISDGIDGHTRDLH